MLIELKNNRYFIWEKGRSFMKKVVIIGGGYAGIYALRELVKEKNIKITKSGTTYLRSTNCSIA